MKSSDIVLRLAQKLPPLTDKFTNNINLLTLTRVAMVATGTTAAAHGLVVGQQINITGSESPITISTLTRSGVIGTLITSTDHDITEITGQVVKMSGSNEVGFNGTFTLINVVNRKTITFTMIDAGPVTATGAPLLLNGSSIFQGYNGLYAVATTPTTTTFTYVLTTTPALTTATGTIVARTNPRISRAISEQRAIDAYTAQPTPNDAWAFVILGDVLASKSRKIDSDATANIQRGEEYRQQLIQPFSVIVIIPTSSEISGADARDLAEDLLRPLCRSLIFSKFDSGLYVGAQNPVVFSDHGFLAYDTAFYVHSYAFQAVADLTFDDTIMYDDNVALRNIDTNIFLDVGTGEDPIEANVDLDNTAL